jgi:hypothetical protein
MSYAVAVASAEADRFQYEANGYRTSIVQDGNVIVLVADDTGQTLARYPFKD